MLLVRLCRLQIPRQWGESALKAGFEEVELLDAVDYGGPQRSSCGPVSRRVRLGWRFLVGVELGYEFGGSWGLFPQSTSMTQIAMPKARNTPNDEASRACVNSGTSVSGSS